MAITVKPVQASADKLAQRAQAAAGEYMTNTKAAGEKWASETQASKANYQQGISGAGIAERFARGVAKAGAAKFVRKVTEVGDRFSTGVSFGKPDYITGVEPYFSTLASLTLSARQPRGSAGNITRVSEVAKALNAKRLALLGMSGG